MTERRVSQEVVEADQTADDVQRRITQALVEHDYAASLVQRRVTQILVEVDFSPPTNLPGWYWAANGPAWGG